MRPHFDDPSIPKESIIVTTQGVTGDYVRYHSPTLREIDLVDLMVLLCFMFPFVL